MTHSQGGQANGQLSVMPLHGSVACHAACITRCRDSTASPQHVTSLRGQFEQLEFLACPQVVGCWMRCKGLAERGQRAKNVSRASAIARKLHRKGREGEAVLFSCTGAAIHRSRQGGEGRQGVGKDKIRGGPCPARRQTKLQAEKWWEQSGGGKGRVGWRAAGMTRAGLCQGSQAAAAPPASPQPAPRACAALLQAQADGGGGIAEWLDLGQTPTEADSGMEPGRMLGVIGVDMCTGRRAPSEHRLTDVEVGLLGGGAHILELLQDGSEVVLQIRVVAMGILSAGWRRPSTARRLPALACMLPADRATMRRRCQQAAATACSSD